VTEPDGWQKIGQTDERRDYEFGHDWFFNADGNQAQTMKTVPDELRPGRRKLVRLRLDVVGSTATIDDLGNDQQPQYEGTVTYSGDRPIGPFCPSLTLRSDENQTQRQSGSSVISVDYRINTPVFARVAASGSGQGSRRVETRTTCDQTKIPYYSTVNVIGTKDLERKITLEDVSLPVEKESGNGQWSTVSLSQVGPSGFASSSKRTVNNRGLFAYDLRYGVVAAHEFSSLRESSSTVEPQGPLMRFSRLCSNLTVRSNDEYYVKLGALILNVYSNTDTRSFPSSCGQDAEIIDPGPGFIPGYADIEVLGTRTLDIFPGQEFRDSIWLIDASEKALGVQAYVERDGQEKRYYFLSGGDLNGLIPGGGQGARYFPVGVIR